MKHRVLGILATTFAVANCLGCALTSKSDAVPVRYFSPEPDGAARAAQRANPAPAATARPASELKLGHIDHASYLDERMVYRDSTYELGYYTERRWSESPEEYLKRQLTQALFEERGLRRVVAGNAPTLEVELTAFEEIRAPQHIARVRLTARLQDPRVARWTDSFTLDVPVQGSTDVPAAVVAAMGTALRGAVAQLVDRVVTTLDAPTPDATSVTAATR